MKLIDVLKNIEQLKQKMVVRLLSVGSQFDTNSYEKTYEMYVDKFGKDATVIEYDNINQLLSDCPVMID